MNNFHDSVLPNYISYYAKGGPSFTTELVTTLGGRETRLAMRDVPLNYYSIKDYRITIKQFTELNNFFYARFGMAYAFKFYDYTDNKVVGQHIAKGDNHSRSFNLIKSYGDENSNVIRRIFKPIADTVKIYIDSNAIEHFILTENGVIELEAPLPQNSMLTANFCFYMVVRFANDKLHYSMQCENSVIIEDLNFIEVIL